MRKDKEMNDFDFPQFSPFELILGEARYILLYDEIDEQSAREVNTKLIAMSMQNPKKPILLEICSCGGSVSHGISIMNTIRTISAPVITIINGEAASMAGIISVVADKRYITPNSYWMGHPVWDIAGGNPQTIKDRGIYLEKLEGDLNNIFKEKTKLTEEEFQKMCRGELWLNSEECLSKGVVDEIVKYPELIKEKPKSKNKRKKSKK